MGREERESKEQLPTGVGAKGVTRTIPLTGSFPVVTSGHDVPLWDRVSWCHNREVGSDRRLRKMATMSLPCPVLPSLVSYSH